MNFVCHNNFMIRTPGLPIQLLQYFESQEKDVYEFIKSNRELDLYFKKALLVSSQALYEVYVNTPEEQKKYEKLKDSLLKYFIRSVARTTPYGYFASVSMGKFSEETKLVKQKGNIIDIRADNDWVNKLIYMFENEQEVFTKLKLCFNTLCYISGDRIKNPYFTNHGKAHVGDSIIRENSIRYTPLIELIQKETASFISYEKLCCTIKQHYKDVDNELIEKTIHMLLENEYLFSNLRIPSYCDDAITYVINVLKETGYNKPIIKKINTIIKLIESYKIDEDISVLKKIYLLMSEIYTSENYVILNVGNDFLHNELSVDIKDKLERLVDLLQKIPVSCDSMERFRQKFLEKYGTNVEVSIFDIIDKNDFDGLSLFKINEINSLEDEKKVNEIINNKIFEGILNGYKEIFITSKDFNEIEYQECECAKTFDLNFLITVADNKYNVFLGPTYGDDKAGAMLQRFSHCLEEKELKQYNSIYKKEHDLYSDEYLLVEARETINFGKVNNILNSNKNYKHYISFGNCKKSNEEILLEDLYIGMTNPQDVYIKSHKYNKKVKIVNDNMLNPNYCNPILRMLKSISQTYEKSLGFRLAQLRNNTGFKYQPRINFEGIIVSPQTWILGAEDLKSSNIKAFSERLRFFQKKYNIDRIVYQEVNDNRLIVNLEKEEYVKLLYSEFKKNKELRLTEIEKGLLDNTVVNDDKGNKFISEFTFSFAMDKIKNKLQHFKKQDGAGSILCKSSRQRLLCEDGWVYFKLYGMGDREEEVISTYIPELLNGLQNNNHFFIRYSDYLGKHLRIRIKFVNDGVGFEKLSEIIQWAKLLISKKIINNIVFDVYEREINRYGGEEIIEDCEQVFIKDSLTVETLLAQYDIADKENLEKSFIFGIINILKNLTDNVEDMFQVIDCQHFDNKYRQEYRKRNKEFLKITEDLLDENINKYLNIVPQYLEEKYSLCKFKQVLNSQISVSKNTNSKAAIILSLIHMYCNRLTGNREYETKYSEIVRNVMYHIVSRNRNTIKKEEINNVHE